MQVHKEGGCTFPPEKKWRDDFTFMYVALWVRIKDFGILEIIANVAGWKTRKEIGKGFMKGTWNSVKKQLSNTVEHYFRDIIRELNKVFFQVYTIKLCVVFKLSSVFAFNGRRPTGRPDRFRLIWSECHYVLNFVQTWKIRFPKMTDFLNVYL